MVENLQFSVSINYFLPAQSRVGRGGGGEKRIEIDDYRYLSLSRSPADSGKNRIGVYSQMNRELFISSTLFLRPVKLQTY